MTILELADELFLLRKGYRVKNMNSDVNLQLNLALTDAIGKGLIQFNEFIKIKPLIRKDNLNSSLLAAHLLYKIFKENSNKL